MPRDLFGDVTRPSISIGSRKWYTLPVSLVSHSAIVAVLIALPILAPAVMPYVLADDSTPIILRDPEIPRPPEKPQPIPEKQAVNPDAAPLDTPNEIRKETGLEAGFEDKIDTAVVGPGGVPGAFDPGIVEPPPPPKPQEPLRVGGSIRAPVKVRDVLPVYPQMAQAARLQGVVILEATIGADGRVLNARVLRSVPLLDPAALDAVRQWEFTPTLLNGVPVPVIMTVTVVFKLS